MHTQQHASDSLGVSVLVVDDHPSISKLVRLFSTRGGLPIDRIDAAANIAQCIERVVSDTYDLILVDGYLSANEDFRDILAAIAPHYAGPIILLSGSHPEDLQIGTQQIDKLITQAVSKDDLASRSFTDAMSGALMLANPATQRVA